ncbi:uncharacterized protein LOC110713501 [Chenopodium quinoa]|uniref:uncharacterized protein LOC110713501 n=1 Tax=Chenopodium quinoa TaxID=63459 RepID=UPI000B76EC3D|nr:uncharacterized protein LOC110713501 [Chenopodium quinoa]
MQVAYWNQRLKERWISTGDLPTSLLYSRVKVRQKRNQILTLKNVDGNWEEDSITIKNLVVDSMKKVLCTSQSLHQGNDTTMVLRELDIPKMLPSQLAHLDKDFTDEEIRRAMFSLNGSKSRGQMGMHWVNRDTIQLPKGMGGLGLRNLVCLNSALLMKQGCGWKFGNGETIMATKNRWMEGKISTTHSLDTTSEIWNWKPRDLLDQDGTGWNHRRLNSCFNLRDATLIASMEVPVTEVYDYMYWLDHKSDRYTVKTGYAFVKGLESWIGNGAVLEFYKVFWALHILPKWKLFVWKLLHNGLATRGNLGRRGLDIQVYCDLCEDWRNICNICSGFYTKPKDIWRGGILGIHLEDNADQSFVDWFLYYIQLYLSLDRKQGHRITFFLATLWGLWNARNNRVFRRSRLNV